MTEDRIRAALARVTALLDGAGARAAQRIPNSEWTVADAAAHLVTGTQLYIDLFRGVPSPVPDMAATVEMNKAHLDEYPERDAAVLARELKAGVEELLAAFTDGDPERMLTWHSGLQLSAQHNADVWLGELLVHGWDMAQALGQPWPIDPADAAAVLTAGLTIAPAIVDADAARGLNGVVEVRLRGQSAMALTWREGALSVGPPGGKADCIVSADPVAMLLQSYGRGGKWKPILTGKIVAYGRKPMLAMRMQNALGNP